MVLAFFGSIFAGIWTSLKYLRFGMSTEMVRASSVPWSFMFSFSTPGSSAMIWISVSVGITSTRGSRSSLTLRLGLETPKASGLSDGLTLPNSLICGLPSGPTVML